MEERRVERAEPRFERVERQEVRAQPSEQLQPRFERAERPDGIERRERRERIERIAPPVLVAPQAAAPVAAERGGERDIDRTARPADGVAGWRWRERQEGRRGRAREVPPAASSPVFGGAISTPETVAQPRGEVSPRPVTERSTFDQLRNRIGAEAWRQDWRRDRRYDWRRHRDRDRSRFRLGIYIDPFGWGYRDWDLGWRLPSRYYSSRYWIHDPWYYSLPPVYGPYRWIRYHGDVLLVDLRTGRVVDRIRRFFWY
jgi:Ni/Co efflux regulator RcnB